MQVTGQEGLCLAHGDRSLRAGPWVDTARDAASAGPPGSKGLPSQGPSVPLSFLLLRTQHRGLMLAPESYGHGLIPGTLNVTLFGKVSLQMWLTLKIFR